MLAEQKVQGEVVEPIYYFPFSIIPQRVIPIEVIALTETVEQVGSIVLSDLARYFSRHSSPHLLSVLKTAQELGLLERRGGIVSITDLGIGFVRASDGKEGIIRAGLGRIEPFKTALELLSKKKAVTIQEVTSSLMKKKVIFGPSQVSEDLVRTTLIEWGISSALLSYDGKAFEILR